MSARTRICLCITELDPGGAEKVFTELASRLDPADWDVQVFCLGAWATQADILRDRGIPVECFGARRIWSFPFALMSLVRRLRSFRPEIVHSFLFHANIVSRLAAWCAGVPVVICGLRVAERGVSWHGWCERMTGRFVTRYLCVSKGVANHAFTEWRIPIEKLQVVANGVDYETLRAQPAVPRELLGIPGDAFAICCVGRLGRQKGYPHLLEAFASALAANPKLFLVCVGDGPDRTALERQSRTLGCDARVAWLGKRNDVAGILKSVDGFALASLWEGMPNAVLEGMAQSLPVVVTRVEGTPEMVVPGVNGWLVEPGDTSGFAAALVEVASDLELAKAYGEASQSIVSNCFTIDDCVRQHVIEYRQLLVQQRVLTSVS